MLQQASARLSRPKLAASYAHWFNDWNSQRAALTVLTRERKRREAAENHREKAEDTAQQKLVVISRERDELLERITILDGGIAARELETQRLLEEEREKRVAHLQRMAARRLGNQGLSRGMSAWVELHTRKAHQRRLLRAASSRIAKPKLSACYVFWRRDWELELEEQRARTAAALEERSRAMAAMLQGADADQARLLAELTAAHAAVQEVAGSAGSQERETIRQMEEQAAREKEARIEHLSQMAARRMGKKELSAGWETWAEMYQAHRRQHRLRAIVFARLVKPRFIEAWTHWYHSWTSQQMHDLRTSHTQQLGSEKKQREHAERELTRTQNEKQMKVGELMVALDEARAAALDYLEQMQAAQRTEEAVKHDLSVMRLKAEAAAELVALQGKVETEEATEERLAKMLADQRTQLLKEAAHMRAGLEKEIEMLRANLADMELKKKAPAPVVAEPEQTDAEGQGKADFKERMKIRADDFFEADEHGCGSLDFDAFCKMYTARRKADRKEVPTMDGMQQLFGNIDLDSSGTVDISEYVQFSLREALQESRGRVLDLFRKWDADNSGYIDKKEFRAALLGLGFECSAADVTAIYADLDPDGSGQIEYQELNARLRTSLAAKVELAGGNRKKSPVGAANAPAKKAPTKRSLAKK